MQCGSGLASHEDSWLLRCLAHNGRSEYGRTYGFHDIRSAREFRDRVPIATYESLEPLVFRIARGERDVLFDGAPVAFERTGGSTGGSKLIPYTANSLRDFRVALLPWLARVVQQYDLGGGCAYWSISPATRAPGTTPSGIRIGLPDGAYLGQDAIQRLLDVSAVPATVGEIEDVGLWQLMTLYWLIRRSDLELVSIWSPTFFLALLEAIPRRFPELEELLSAGARITGRRLPPDRAAARRLRAYVKDHDSRSLWPRLKLVSCWADGASTTFVEQLRDRLPQSHFEGKGLVATEGVVTVPHPGGCPVLAADSGFFEFLDSTGRQWFAWELESGQLYEVIVTTSGGLYRYRLGDQVLCEGFVGSQPRLRFVGRSGLVSDLVGEKLTENFVADCLEGIPGFRMLIPLRHPAPGYALVADARLVDEPNSVIRLAEGRLSRNPQYSYARRIGQLQPLSIIQITDPLRAYMARAERQGIRVGDVKVAALRPETDWAATFLEFQS